MKQNVVARSSAKVEFRTLAQGVCELLCMRIILNDLKVACEELMTFIVIISQPLALLTT